MLRKAFITFADKTGNVIARTYPQQYKKPFDSVNQNSYEVIEYSDDFDVKSEATNQLHIAPANHNGLSLKIAVDNSAIIFLNDMVDPANKQIGSMTVSFYSAGSASTSDPSKPANLDFTANYKQPQLKEFSMVYNSVVDEQQPERNLVDLTILAPTIQYKWTNGNREATYGVTA